jgi:hypothetical protein
VAQPIGDTACTQSYSPNCNTDTETNSQSECNADPKVADTDSQSDCNSAQKIADTDSYSNFGL